MIKVLKDEKGYTINIPMDCDKYKVNGQWVKSGLCTIKDEPKIECFTPITLKLHWKSLLPGMPNLNIDQYQHKLTKLQSIGYYEDDTEGYQVLKWKKPSDKIAFEVFKMSYQLITKKGMTKVADEELEIYPKVPVTDPYMVPLRCLDADLFSQKARYARRGAMINKMKTLLTKAGFKLNDRSFSDIKSNEYKYYDHNDLSFYIGKDFSHTWTCAKVVTDNYTTVAKMRTKDEADIEEIFKDYLNTASIGINKYNLSNLITELKNIQCSIQRIDYKTKSRSEYCRAINMVNELNGKIRSFAKVQANEMS